jgi:hypothetical protein
MNKPARQHYRGNVYANDGALIGALYAADGGYRVHGHDNMGRVAAPLFNGRIFAGADFAFIQKVDFGYAVERQYKLAA